jgi:hypothetical protein
LLVRVSIIGTQAIELLATLRDAVAAFVGNENGPALGLTAR